MTTKKEMEKLLADFLEELRHLTEQPCATDELIERLFTINSNLKTLSQKTLLSGRQEETIPIIVRGSNFYSALDVSQKMNVTPVTILNYLKQGKLKGQKAMGRWFILDEDLE